MVSGFLLDHHNTSMGCLPLLLIFLLMIQASCEPTFEESPKAKSPGEDLIERPQSEPDSFGEIDPILKCFLLSADMPASRWKAFNQPASWERDTFCLDYMAMNNKNLQWEGSSLQKYYFCKHNICPSNMILFDIPFAIAEVRTDLVYLCSHSFVDDRIFIYRFHSALSSALNKMNEDIDVDKSKGICIEEIDKVFHKMEGLDKRSKVLDERKRVDLRERHKLEGWADKMRENRMDLTEQIKAKEREWNELYLFLKDLFYHRGLSCSAIILSSSLARFLAKRVLGQLFP